jgi:peptide deformylase
MNKFIQEQEGKTNIRGIGLAAPQVGESKRIFLAYSLPSKKFLIFINPEIVWKSRRMLLGFPSKNKLEGCLSIPGIWGLVRRHQVVKIRYQTPSGQTVIRKFKGFLGIICQHEYDHLEGILFTDRVLEQNGKLYQLKKDEEGKERLVEAKLT